MRHEIEPTLNTRSISFLVAFRDLRSNGLTELPPGIFDSLASLTRLYVLSLIMETCFVSCLLQPDLFFFLHPDPARCNWIGPLLYGWAWSIFFIAWPWNFLVRGAAIKALMVADCGAWDWANSGYLIDFIPCWFQKSQHQWPNRAVARHLRFPGFAVSLVRTFAVCTVIFFPCPSPSLIFSSAFTLTQRNAAR